MASCPDTKEILSNGDKHSGFLSAQHEPKHFRLIENRACNDLLRAGWKRSACHLQHVPYTLTTASNHSRLKPQRLGRERRNVLFRGRWSGGRKAGKARRGFRFMLREAVEPPVHCARTGSVILPRKPLTIMTAKYNFPTYPVFQSASRVST